MPQRSSTTPRRRFLDGVLGLGFVSSIGAMFYPLFRFMIPPAVGEPVTTSVVAGRLSEVGPGTGRLLRFGSRPALLVRTASGELRAFNATCTHLDCTVQYRPDSASIWCACHDGVFDLAGNVVAGPPPRPLERLQVDLRGDPGQEEIVVSRQ